MALRVKEEYDGRLPVYHVVKEISTCNNCNVTKDEIIKTFDTYEEAVEYADNMVSEARAKAGLTPCGEEMP